MKRVHITVEWSAGRFRLNGYSQKATKRLGRVAVEYLEKVRAVRELEIRCYKGEL